MSLLDKTGSFVAKVTGRYRFCFNLDSILANLFFLGKLIGDRSRVGFGYLGDIIDRRGCSIG